MATREKQVLKGALWLTLAGLLAKVLSVVYRVPFQNIVGDTGFYAYQQVYPIYGIGTIFALSGLPNAVAEVVAGERKLVNRQYFLRRYFILMLVVGVLIFSGLFFGRNLLAQEMGDIELAPAIGSISGMFLVFPVVLMLRGAYQARQDMIPVAVAQVVEQVARVAMILGVAYWSVHQGDHSVYTITEHAMRSVWVAAFAATSILSLFLLGHRGTRRYFKKPRPVEDLPAYLGWGALVRRFLREGLLLCLLSALPILLQLLDAFTIYDHLLLAGLAPNMAKATKGIYDRGQPLVQLGLVLAMAFQTTYLPLLRNAWLGINRRRFRALFNMYLRLVVFVGILVTAGLVAIMPQMNHMLFHSRAGSWTLVWYVLTITWLGPVLALFTAHFALNHKRVVFGGLALGLLLKGVINGVLVMYFGVNGAAWGSLLSLTLMLCWSFYFLPAWTKKDLGLRRLLRDLLPLAGGMLVLVRLALTLFSYWLGQSRLADTLAVVLGVTFGALCVLLYLRQRPVLSKKEWQAFPGSAYFLPYLNLKERNA